MKKDVINIVDVRYHNGRIISVKVDIFVTNPHGSCGGYLKTEVSPEEILHIQQASNNQFDIFAKQNGHIISVYPQKIDRNVFLKTNGNDQPEDDSINGLPMREGPDDYRTFEILKELIKPYGINLH